MKLKCFAMYHNLKYMPPATQNGVNRADFYFQTTKRLRNYVLDQK